MQTTDPILTAFPGATITRRRDPDIPPDQRWWTVERHGVTLHLVERHGGPWSVGAHRSPDPVVAIRSYLRAGHAWRSAMFAAERVTA